MKKIIWIPLVILIIGICIALAGFANGGMKSLWLDRAGFHIEDGSQGNLITVDETYDSFKNIEIKADYIERIEIKEGNSFSVRGQNYEHLGSLIVSKNGDTVRVDSKSDDKLIFSIGVEEVFNKNDTWIEITYPAGSNLGLVDTDLSAGSITISNINCDDLNVDNDFGKTDLSTVQANKLTVVANAGDVNLSNIIVTGNVTIDNDFGDVDLANVRANSLTTILNSGRLKTSDIFADRISLKNDFGKIEVDGIEATELKMDLNSGDLDADNVSSKNLSIESDFGKIDIDRLTFTGECDVENNSGSINLNLLMNKDDISYELEADAGSVTVDGQTTSKGAVSSRAARGTTKLEASTDFGGISVNFLG